MSSDSLCGDNYVPGAKGIKGKTNDELIALIKRGFKEDSLSLSISDSELKKKKRSDLCSLLGLVSLGSKLLSEEQEQDKRNKNKKPDNKQNKSDYKDNSDLEPCPVLNISKEYRKQIPIIPLIPLADELNCDKLGLLINENNSCYLDVTILSLLHWNNQYIYDNMLNMHPAMVKLSIAREYDKCVDLVKKTVKKERCSLIKPMTGFPALADKFTQIVNDLRQIRNDMILGNHDKCSLLRTHLQQYLQLFNKETGSKANPEFAFDVGQQEPAEAIENFIRIFQLPDSAIVSSITYVTNSDSACSGADLIKVEEIREKSGIVPSIEKRDIANYVDGQPVALKKPVDLVSLLSSSCLGVVFEPENYRTYEGKKYKRRVEFREYVKAPMLFIPILRNMPHEITGNKTFIKTPINFPEILQLKENPYPLYLSSIIMHSGGSTGGHYMGYFNCQGTWYFYNDLYVGKGSAGKGWVKIGNFAQLIKSSDDILTHSTAFVYQPLPTKNKMSSNMQAEIDKAIKLQAEQDYANKLKADKQKADKQKADKQKADKQKADKQKADANKSGSYNLDENKLFELCGKQKTAGKSGILGMGVDELKVKVQELYKKEGKALPPIGKATRLDLCKLLSQTKEGYQLLTGKVPILKKK